MSKSSTEFLSWLYNRLKIKHNEDPDVLNVLLDLINNKRVICKQISKDVLNKVCKKNYPGFVFDYCPETKIGYSPDEKAQIENIALAILQDTLLDQ